MNGLPWRTVFFALAIGAAACFTFTRLRPNPSPSAVIVPPWDAASGQCTSLAFSPDDTLLIAQLGNQTVWVFQARDGKLISEMDGSGCAFSPTGKQFAIYGFQRLTILDAHTGKQVADSSKAVSGQLLGVCFDANDRVYAAMSTGEKLIVRDLDSGQVQMQLPRHPDLKCGSPLDRLLAVETNGTCELWDMTTGLAIGKMPVRSEPHLSKSYADGRTIFHIYADGVQACDLASGAVRKLPFGALFGWAANHQGPHPTARWRLSMFLRKWNRR